MNRVLRETGCFAQESHGVGIDTGVIGLEVCECHRREPAAGCQRRFSAAPAGHRFPVDSGSSGQAEPQKRRRRSRCRAARHSFLPQMALFVSGPLAAALAHLVSTQRGLLSHAVSPRRRTIAIDPTPPPRYGTRARMRSRLRGCAHKQVGTDVFREEHEDESCCRTEFDVLGFLVAPRRGCSAATPHSGRRIARPRVGIDRARPHSAATRPGKSARRLGSAAATRSARCSPNRARRSTAGARRATGVAEGETGQTAFAA